MKTQSIPKLTKTEGKEGQIISAMESLKRDQAWKYICEVLDINIKGIEDIILNGEDMEKAELTKWKDKRTCYIDLKNTPELIIGQLQQGTDQKEMSLDPYE